MMVCKEEVVDWFQRQSAAGRVETLCSILDLCLPFELRFIGTVLEHLGRRDFQELREPALKANGTGGEKTTLVTALAESLPNTPSGPNHSIHNEKSSNRPILTHNPKNVCEGEVNRRSNGSNKAAVVFNGCGEEEEELPILADEKLRRKLVLWLSLVEATNRDSANAYFALLSDLDGLLGPGGWLDSQEKCVQEEILLLYTIGHYHPAFNFEQRTFLGSIIARIRPQILTKFDMKYPHGPFSPFQFNNASTGTTHRGVLHGVVRVPLTFMNNQQFKMVQNCESSHLGSSTLLPHLQISSSPLMSNPPRGVILDVGRDSGGGPQPNQPILFRPQYSFPFLVGGQQTVMKLSEGQSPPPNIPIPQSNPLMPLITLPPPSRPSNSRVLIEVGGGNGGGNATGPPEVMMPSSCPPELKPSLIKERPEPTTVQKPRKISCYNCGSQTHVGPECKETTFEEITKNLYRLNYNSASSPTSSSSEAKESE